MKPPSFLTDGYERFRASDRAGKVTHLAGGQAPKVMVIGCSDSRVHPATIFDADPGEVFMVRNVANIVPAADINKGIHSTSAALEFAVNSLKIEYILILGHSGCGGVAASFMTKKSQPVGDYIGPWVELMKKARDQVLKAHPNASDEELHKRLEMANVRNSMDNLLTFPFISKAVEADNLSILGARFNIETATLEWAE